MSGSEENGAARLEVSLPDGRSSTHELTHDQTNLGRGDQCELQVDDENVSRLHAVVSKRADGYWVTDLGSLNGVIINGKQVESAPLKDGDKIALGTSSIVFRQSASAAAEQPSAAAAGAGAPAVGGGGAGQNPMVMFIAGALAVGTVVAGIVMYLGSDSEVPQEQPAAVVGAPAGGRGSVEDAAAEAARIAADMAGSGDEEKVAVGGGAAEEPGDAAAKAAAAQAAAAKVAADQAAAEQASAAKAAAETAAAEQAVAAKAAADKAAADAAAAEQAAAAKVAAERAAAEQAAAAKAAADKAAADTAAAEQAAAKVAAEKAAAEQAAAAKVAAEKAAADTAAEQAAAKAAAEKAAAETAAAEQAAAKAVADKAAAETAAAEQAAAAKAAAEKAAAETAAAEQAAAAKAAADKAAAETAAAEEAAAAKAAADKAAAAEEAAAAKAAAEKPATNTAAAAATGGELTGRQIMDEQERRHGVDAEFIESVMILVDETGTKERRIMKNYTKEMPDGQDRSMIVFLEPAKVRGTALLTWEQKSRDDDQWLYLPSQKKLQRIAQGSKRSYFMGTDFTYEDNQSEQLDDYQYTVIRSDTFEGRECWVLESLPNTPKKKKESGYSKRLMWVGKDIYFSVKIEYFDRRGRAVKTQTNHKLVNVGGQAWRPDQTLMDNFDRNHKTLRGTQNRKINPALDDSIFTERYIKAERHLD